MTALQEGSSFHLGRRSAYCTDSACCCLQMEWAGLLLGCIVAVRDDKHCQCFARTLLHLLLVSKSATAISNNEDKQCAAWQKRCVVAAAYANLYLHGCYPELLPRSASAMVREHHHDAIERGPVTLGNMQSCSWLTSDYTECCH